MNQGPFVAFLENSKYLQEECIFNAAYAGSWKISVRLLMIPASLPNLWTGMMLLM